MTVIIRNHNLFCDKCGAEHKITYPTKVEDLTKKIKLFEELHIDCEQTWKQPTIDPALSEFARAEWWWKYGERGMSSESIWVFFTKRGSSKTAYPHDPDDFRRCYELLKVMPEWRDRINEVGLLSNAWFQLTSNWGKLEEMLLDLIEKSVIKEVAELLKVASHKLVLLNKKEMMCSKNDSHLKASISYCSQALLHLEFVEYKKV